MLAQQLPADAAKAATTSWSTPERPRFSLDPDLRDLLGPVVASLHRAGFAPDSDRLAAAPDDELLRLSGLASMAALENEARRPYDAQEQAAALRSLAGSWRRHLVRLGVLALIGPADSRAVIRNHAESMERRLPANPTRPSELRPSLGELFPTEATWQTRCPSG